MPKEEQIIAFKIGARARKMATEGCVIEGYEMLYTAIRECKESQNTVMLDYLSRELEKYEVKCEDL